MNTDSVLFNLDGLRVSVDKLDIYKKEFDLLVENMNQVMIDCVNCYHTKNSIFFEEKNSVLYDNLVIIKNIYEDDIDYIKKEMVTFQNVVLDVEHKFKELGDVHE